MRIVNLVSILILFSVSVTAATSYGNWAEDGTPVAAIPEAQVDPYSCSDGDGGIIVVWQDRRNGSDYNIHAQRIDEYGRYLWGHDGILVCDFGGSQFEPRIAPDGQGGAVVVWIDDRNSLGELYAQRIDEDGLLLWRPDTRVYGYSYGVDYLGIDGDGFGGMVVTWSDDHEDLVTSKAYAQRLAGLDGRTLWGTDGVNVTYSPYDQSQPDIVATGGGGALVVWRESRTAGTDIYGVWIHPGGALEWVNGFPLCTASGQQRVPRACTDGQGGFIVAWRDERGGLDEDIYAAGLDTTGVMTMTDVPVCTAVDDQTDIVLVPDDQGGAYVAWLDDRSAPAVGIYAQRVLQGGTVDWAADGVAVCTASSGRLDLVMTADGFGGAVMAWGDSRGGFGSDLYAHRLEPDGLSDWTPDGVLLSDAAYGQSPESIVSDGRMGAIVSFGDTRNWPDWDVYVQRVEDHGYWGYPSPWIADIADIPFDQGGRVEVTWDASPLDAWPRETVTHYSVWRRLGAKDLAARKAHGIRQVNLVDIAVDFSGPAVLAGGPDKAGGWEWLANLPAHWLDLYGHAAVTLNDSLAGNPGWHHFFVASHTDDPFVFWDSPADSGYSVDNLAPGAPGGLAGQAVYQPLGLDLTWDANPEGDLFGYRVYRGTDPGFVPGGGNLLVSVTEPAALDDHWNPANGFHYKVTAVDVHGNEGPWALLEPDQLADTPGQTAIQRPFLTGHPNPFNPSLRISYGLVSGSEVVLRIFDARGRELVALAQGRQTAGHHVVSWDGRDRHGRILASGTYFCKLEAEGLHLVHKLMLVR